MTHSVTCIVTLSGIITVLYYVYFIFDCKLLSMSLLIASLMLSLLIYNLSLRLNLNFNLNQRLKQRYANYLTIDCSKI